MREGWLRHSLEHARIYTEEVEKARVRTNRRMKRYEKEHPLGPEEPETDHQHLDF